MTDDTDRVLASIDEAIDGYVTGDWMSPDAMRWRPEPPKPMGHVGQMDQSQGQARHSPEIHGYRRPVYSEEQIRQGWEAFRRVVVPQFAQVQRAFAEMGKFLRRTVDANHPVFARAVHGDDYRRHRRRCAICNPAGNPKPLAVNGAEYRRRTRSRRRRNRR